MMDDDDDPRDELLLLLLLLLPGYLAADDDDDVVLPLLLLLLLLLIIIIVKLAVQSNMRTEKCFAQMVVPVRMQIIRILDVIVLEHTSDRSASIINRKTVNVV